MGDHDPLQNGTDHQQGEASLESVIATEQLDLRESRVPDRDAESRTTLALIKDLAKAPDTFFQKLVHAVMECSIADSAGISLLDIESGSFIWPAVVGGLSPFLGGGTPMDFGPCGTVLDRDAAVLFIHPERHFTYLEPITPVLEEVLLFPFHVNGKAVGTIWAVIHEQGKHFDAEDRRLLENLSAFAATAYRTLSESGALKTMLDQLPQPEPPKARPITHDNNNWAFVK